MESNQDIFDKLAEAESLSADDIIIPITFEPFSFLIVQELKKLKSNIERNRLYESILNDERTVLLHEGELAKTVMFPNHKTNDEFWPETKEMAFALNECGFDVCFLPEVGDKLKVPRGQMRLLGLMVVGLLQISSIFIPLIAIPCREILRKDSSRLMLLC